MAGTAERYRGDIMTKYTAMIEGMMCGMCEAHISDAIRKQFPEAKNVKASASKGSAVFVLKDAMPRPMILHELHTAVDPLGYRLTEVTQEEVEARERHGFFHKR